jgi:hypothetical protein
MAKSVVFGVLIALIGCHWGLRVKPNTEEPGRGHDGLGGDVHHHGDHRGCAVCRGIQEHRDMRKHERFAPSPFSRKTLFCGKGNAASSAGRPLSGGRWLRARQFQIQREGAHDGAHRQTRAHRRRAWRAARVDVQGLWTTFGKGGEAFWCTRTWT